MPAAFVRFLDSTGFTVGAVAADVCAMGATGVVTNNGDVSLVSTPGPIMLAKPITTTPTGGGASTATVRLNSGAAVLQTVGGTGTITAANLAVVAAGNVDLCQVANTVGTVAVNGRVSALLELGAGFNPEFTGRENVYLNGSILGLSTRQIEARYPEIAAFAEIGDFIDQPVKTYSSGMVVRLAFAVAIHVDPEILLVDEALAVGDIYFRQRCMRKVHELRSRGVTILFVSHAVSDIPSL